MLGGGVSRGQARSRPSTAHGHSSLRSSFNPLSGSYSSTSCVNPNPTGLSLSSNMNSSFVNKNSFMLESGIGVLSSAAISGSSRQIPIESSSNRSIDLRRRSKTQIIEAEEEKLQAPAHYRENGRMGKEGSAEILPLLLETPKLSVLPNVSGGGKTVDTNSHSAKTQVDTKREYIPASSSSGIELDEMEVTLPDVANQQQESYMAQTIPIVDECKTNGQHMLERRDTSEGKTHRPLPKPVVGTESREIDVPRVDRMDLSNIVQPSIPAERKQDKNYSKVKKNNMNVVLPPVRKADSSSSVSRMRTSSSSSEEEERKESGDTDSESETKGDSTVLVRKPCGGSFGSRVPSSGARGLKNLGNTCYMNSTLQCLSNIPSFRDYFLRKHHLEEINTTRGAAEGDLAKAFGQLLSQLWSSRTSGDGEDAKPVKPEAVKRIIGKVASRFSGYQQHDAQEFLLFFLDALHDDLNRVSHKVPFEEIKDIAGESVEERSARCWKNYTDRNDSVVVDTFCGQLHSEIICQACGKTSNVFEPFMDLSTPIPVVADRKVVRVQDCLDAFTKTEILSGMETVYCSQCKDHRESMKTIRIHKLPNVLVVHLKRFSSHKKLGKAVDIPISSLDMNPYSSKSAQLDGEPADYRLIGAVNHMGSFYGGHYTADCFQSEARKWLKFNDSIVTPIGTEQIDNEDAYLLIYQRMSKNRENEKEWSHL